MAGTEEVVMDEGEFDRVFAQITNDDPQPGEKPAETADSAVKAGEEGEKAEIPADSASETPAEPVVETAPVAEAAPAAEEIDWKAKFDALQAEIEVLKTPKEAAEPEKTAEKTQETPTETALPGYKYTEEEATALKTYDEDWPEIAKSEAIRRRAEIYNAVAYVFNEINKTYGPALQRATVTAEVVDDQVVLNELRSRHPDYDSIYDEVLKWTDLLPSAFKRAAKATIENGTVDEVSDLISTYKQTVTKGAPAPAVAGATNLSDAAKKAAKALSVVSSKRSAVTTEDDPDDFDGAWAAATRSRAN